MRVVAAVLLATLRQPAYGLVGAQLLVARSYCRALVAHRSTSIPLERLEFNFARSSGPGGQNVNKVNTKAEIRFKVSEADWLSEEVRTRLAQYQESKINKEGYLVVTSQEHRTQMQNKADCIQKLQEMIDDASIEPKQRQQWEGIGEKGKAARREEKKRRSEVKSNRRMSKFDFD